MKSVLPAASLALLLAACSSFSPPRPPAPPTVGSHWRVPDGFKLAEPADGRIPQDWWQRYGDPDLDALEASVPAANQSLAVADAQYRQALASTASAASALSPTLNLSASASRSQQPILTTGGLSSPPASNLFTLATQASWEPDLWGAIHANVAAAKASEQASLANRGAVLLSLQAQLATDYFALRVADETIRLLNQTAQDYASNLELTRLREHAGVAAHSDVTEAQSQLESARATLADARINRDTLEHAIAVLVGRPASDFSIAPRAWAAPQWPELPLGIPSTLLERRPDIANAERLVASAAARLNAADAAFYPLVTLSAQLGFESKQARNWINLPRSFWSIGPQLTQTLLDGDNHIALRNQALANLDQATASYREVVLESFQSVEDSLSSLALLAQEQERQRANAAAARETLDLVSAQYQAGIVGYLNVISAETTLLGAESSVLALEGRKAAAHVQLVKALGGGWQAAGGASAGAGQGDQGR